MSIFNYIYEVAEMPVTSVSKGVRNIAGARKRNTREFEFGPDPNQKVILYEPKEVKHDTAVIFFHGGGFLLGTPESMGVTADFFCRNGYRFISAGYRLLRSAPFPAQVEDAFRGYSVAVKLLEMGGLADTPIVVAGNSAGGMLAALLAYGQELQLAFGVDTGRIAGVLSLAGVMDADRMFGGMLSGKLTSVDTPAALMRYSPIEVIDGRSTARFLAIHGRHDKMAPYSDSVKFVRQLNAIDQARMEMASSDKARTGSSAGSSGRGADAPAGSRAAGSDAPAGRYRTSGGGSKPSARYSGWSSVVLEEREPQAELMTLKKWKYQHIRLTAGAFTEDQKSSRVLRKILRWMEKFDGLRMGTEEDPIYPSTATLTRETFHKPLPEKEKKPKRTKVKLKFKSAAAAAEEPDAGGTAFGGTVGEEQVCEVPDYEETVYREPDDMEPAPDAKAGKSFHTQAYESVEQPAETMEIADSSEDRMHTRRVSADTQAAAVPDEQEKPDARMATMPVEPATMPVSPKEHAADTENMSVGQQAMVRTLNISQAVEEHETEETGSGSEMPENNVTGIGLSGEAEPVSSGLGLNGIDDSWTDGSGE